MQGYRCTGGSECRNGVGEQRYGNDDDRGSGRDSERRANEWQWRGALNQHPGDE